MASERRAQVVQLAELLEIEFERGIGTAELMTLCIAEVEGRGSNWGQEPEEESKAASEAPPEGFRPALRSVPTEAVAPTSSSGGKRRGRVEAREAEAAAEVDASELAGGAEEIAPAVAYTRREKRRGGARKAS